MKKPLPLVRKLAFGLFVCQLGIPGAAVAQNLTMASHAQVSLTQESQTKVLLEVLQGLENRFGVIFDYNRKALKGKTVTVTQNELQAQELEIILAKLLPPLDLTYERYNARSFLIYKRKEKTRPGAGPGTTSAGQGEGALNHIPDPEPSGQNSISLSAVQVKGKVTGDNGEGLPGVSVAIKGTTTGTATDQNGAYSLTVPGEQSVLVFSFIGYVTEEVLVGTQSTIDVQLVADIKSLQEVVVVGYGEQKRDKITSAVSQVAGADIVRNPNINLTNSLVGRVTGVISTQTSGEPGNDDATLYIRGVGTSGTSSPIYVIDQVVRTREDFSRINPNEIESVNVLKDAAAAAVYGVRGGNGVILVTTKRGAAGKSTLDYSFNYGIQRATRLPQFLGSYDYALLKNESLQNSGNPVLYGDDQLQQYRNGSDPDRYPDTDWLGEALKPYAPQTQHNLSLGGGIEKVRYFVAFGYANQQGLYRSPNGSYDRYNLRSNVDVEATKTTHISVDLSGRIQAGSVPATGQTETSQRMRETWEEIMTKLPTEVARYSNGYYAKVNRGGNPLVRLDGESGYSRNNDTQFLGRFTVTQDLPFVPGLSLKAVAAYDKGYTYTKNWGKDNVHFYALNNQGEFVDQNPVADPSLQETFGQNQRLTLEGHLNYARSFGRHTLSALALYSQQEYTSNFTQGTRSGFISNQVDQLSVGGTGPGNQQSAGGAGEFAIKGMVGRLTYDYNGKYLAEISGRYDGSSYFPADKRWGFFPSASLGWIVTQENFMSGLSFLNFLKVRGSVGLLGNDQLSYNGTTYTYYYYSKYFIGPGYPLGGAVGGEIYQGSLPNLDVTWEKVRKTNVGLEARFLRNRFSLEADYFFDHRTGILGVRSLSVPATFGAGLPVENISTINNRGIELALGYENKLHDVLDYFLKGTFTFARNKQVFIDEPLYTAGTAAERNRQTGRSLNQQFGYRALGIFGSQSEIDGAPKQADGIQPGDLRYEDVNGDGKVDAQDVVQIGRSTVPELIYGLMGGLKFGGFDLNFLFQGGARSSFSHSAILNNGNQKYVTENLDRWTPANPGGSLPRLSEPGSPSSVNNGYSSSFWVKDISYLRLKNLEIGYSLPPVLTGKVRMQQLRLFANGSNLLTFTQFKKYIDPENTALNALSYPQLQIFNFGVNVQF